MSKQKLISDSRIRTMVSLIDLTDLSDNCDPAAIDMLCHQARTPVADVAAVCIWPTFIAQAKNNLGPSSSVKVATVVNFPAGDHSLGSVCTAIDKALDDGADEIDYVMPYRELINGNVIPVASALKTVRNQVPDNKKLKTILETGELGSDELIRTAATIAIDQGADFIKTSTGKVPINATEESARVMLDAILNAQRNNVGFKAAGGIRTLVDADVYLKLAEERFGQHWIDSAHFRFGASGLLQDALSNLKVEPSQSTGNRGDY